MRMLVLVLVGCAGTSGSNGQGGANGQNGANGATGATGPRGPTGATGPAGPAGAPGGGFQWFDAAGVQVTDSSELAIWTPDDLLWYLDAETAQVADNVALAYFTETGCHGDTFIAPISVRPRIPVELPSTGDWLVRRDDALPVHKCGLQSFQGPGGTCTSLGSPTCEDALDASDMDAPTPPDTSGYTAPLHPERIK